MQYLTLSMFLSYTVNERCIAAACLPQLEGEDTTVAGWIVDKGDAGYEWEVDEFAPQTAQDYLDILSH